MPTVDSAPALARCALPAAIDRVETSHVALQERPRPSLRLPCLVLLAASLFGTASVAHARDQWGGLVVFGSRQQVAERLRFRAWDKSLALPKSVAVRIEVGLVKESAPRRGTHFCSRNYWARSEHDTLSVVLGNDDQDSVALAFSRFDELRITISTLAPQPVSAATFVYRDTPGFQKAAYAFNCALLLMLASLIAAMGILDRWSAARAPGAWEPFKADVRGLVLLPLFVAFVVWALQYFFMIRWPNLQLSGENWHFGYPGNIGSLTFSALEGAGFLIAGTKLLLLRPRWRRVHPMLPPTQRLPGRIQALGMYVYLIGLSAWDISRAPRPLFSVGLVNTLMGILSLWLFGFGLAREMRKHSRDAVSWIAVTCALVYPAVQPLGQLSNVISTQVALLALVLKVGLFVSLVSFPVVALRHGRMYATLGFVFHTLLGPVSRIREQTWDLVKELENAEQSPELLAQVRARVLANLGQAQALAWTASLHRELMDSHTETQETVKLCDIARDIFGHFDALSRYPEAFARALGPLLSPDKLEHLYQLAGWNPGLARYDEIPRCCCFRVDCAPEAVDISVYTHRDTAGMILRELMVNALRHGGREVAPSIAISVAGKYGVVAVESVGRTSSLDGLRGRLKGDSGHLGLMLCRSTATRYGMTLAVHTADMGPASATGAERSVRTRAELSIPVSNVQLGGE